MTNKVTQETITISLVCLLSIELLTCLTYIQYKIPGRTNTPHPKAHWSTSVNSAHKAIVLYLPFRFPMSLTKIAKSYVNTSSHGVNSILMFHTFIHRYTHTCYSKEQRAFYAFPTTFSVYFLRRTSLLSATLMAVKTHTHTYTPVLPR